MEPLPDVVKPPGNSRPTLWWMAVPLLELYAALAVASISHRHLFLDAPIGLPLLGLAVPPTFLAVATPLLMLTLLASAVRGGGRAGDPSVAPVVRWIVQLIAPLLILLQVQLVFLPLHAEPLTWFRRLTLMLGLALAGTGTRRPRSKRAAATRLMPTAALVIFSIGLATFPGEWLDTQLRFLQRPAMLRPTNTLDLQGQSFAPPAFGPPDAPGPSLRGRRLEGANFFLTDLRQADFAGARLDGADFVQADLRGASFAGASLRGASFGNGALDGADFSDAMLTGADLNAALQGLNFAGADLRGTLFGFGVPTHLEGANLARARLDGAVFEAVNLQGADLRAASLVGVTVASMADFGTNASLDGANLEGAHLQGAALQGASLAGASLNQAQLWRTSGVPILHATDATGIDRTTRPTIDIAALSRLSANNPFQPEQQQRLTILAASNEPPQATPPNIWPTQPASTAELAQVLADLICAPPPENAEPPRPPHLARGLIANGRLAATRNDIARLAARMKAAQKTPSDCPGVAGFTESDWAALDALVAAAR